MREDDVEDDHSARKAITVLRNISEQGIGVGNSSLFYSPDLIRCGNECHKVRQ